MASDKTVDLDDVAKQIAKLQAVYEKGIQEKRSTVLDETRKTVAQFKFTAFELGIAPARAAFKRKPAEIKYVNPDNRVQTWTGRGRQPAWTTANGRKLSDCAVKASA